MRSMSAGSMMSVRTKAAAQFAWRISAATRSPPSALTSASTNLAPSRA
jgi:hypothetical protein